MSHFDSLEIDINPCDDDDIDEQIQIYVYNTLVTEIPDDKMNLVLNEKEIRHYQDYGQGLKKMLQQFIFYGCILHVRNEY